jgi:hypothetical protein
MKIYNYDPEYKIYLNSSASDESPLEPGVFLIPAYATKLEPPEYPEGTIPVFNGTSWDIIEDQRGTYYSTVNQEKVEIINPLKVLNNLTKKVPPKIPAGYYLTWEDDEDDWKLFEYTLEQKLGSLGINIEDLKSLLN